MKQLNLVIFCAAAVAIGGCASVGALSSTKNSESLHGTWKGKLEVKKTGNDDLASTMAEGLGKAFFGDSKLELRADNTFSMNMIMFPIEGSYVQNGDSLTLTPKTIMGMTREQLKTLAKQKGDQANLSSMSETMTITVEDGGKRLVLHDKKNDESTIVFERAPAKAAFKEGAYAVNEAEAALVGDYAGEVADTKGAKAEDVEVAKMLVGSSSLKLRADKTFSMKLMMPMEGTWSMAGDRLTLKPTEVMGDAVTGGNSSGGMTVTSEDIMFAISSDGLAPVTNKKGVTPPPFIFKKK